MVGARDQSLKCGAGNLLNLRWLGRRCRTAHLQLQKAMRSGPSRMKFGCGAGLLVACAAVGPAATSPSEGSPDGRRRKTLSDFGHPRRRATDVFLVLNAVVFALNWLTKDALLLWGCKINSLIAGGQLWRLVTPMFLHSNLFHCLINMHALHTLGPQVEVVSGTKRTAVIYVASGVLATVVSFLASPAPSAGASGAIFGLGAALGLFYMRHREVLGPASEAGLRGLGLTVVINVMYSLVNKKLDNWGHIGGALSGFLLAYLLGPKLVVTRGPNGARGLQDLPLVRWLAFKTPAQRETAEPATPSSSAALPPPSGRRRPSSSREDPGGGSDGTAAAAATAPGAG